MPNEFYTKTGAPSTSSAGTSATIRGEFAAIEAGFNKFPELSTNAGKALAINASGTGVEAVAAAAGGAGKDESDGFPGLTLFKINIKNAANTLTNFFTNATTAPRTWTLPDKDGTVAMTSDIPTGLISSSPTAGFGYGAGAGSSVTQTTSKSTAVTINKVTGVITTHSENLAGLASVMFTVNNSTIQSTDMVFTEIHHSYADKYTCGATVVSAGSFTLWIRLAATADRAEALPIRFAVIRSSAS
jgi:hypothetical protein